MGFFFGIPGMNRDKGIEMLSVPRAGFSKLRASERGLGADTRATEVDIWLDFSISW
jgi:hypothetical protein